MRKRDGDGKNSANREKILKDKLERLEAMAASKASKHELDKLEEKISVIVNSEDRGNVISLSESFYSESGQTIVPSSNPFPLTNSSFELNIGLSNNHQIVQNNSKYLIMYSVSYSSGLGSSVAIYVNDIVVVDSVININSEPGSISGFITLNLSSGDRVSLVNNSDSQSITLDVSSKNPINMIILEI